MNISKAREIISTRKSLHPDDDYATYVCWEQLTNILSEDIHKTILFIENECSDEEFYRMSEIFEDIVQKTQFHR